MASRKYYRFLDTAIDVYFGIILFTLFLEFPELHGMPQIILFFNLVLFMLFTWWEFRTIEQIPKHYFFDFVLLGLEMFCLTQVSLHLDNVQGYLTWLIAALSVDFLDSALDRIIHKPNREERRYLRFFLTDDAILGVLYLIAFFALPQLNTLSAIIVTLPLVASICVSVIYNVTELKARYEV
ncbi:MAG: hypothetical protein U0517_04200 [Candidatus Andersenbacteria bacterium]